MIDKLADENVKMLFNLKGVDVWGGVSRAAGGYGFGATDWELFKIYQSPEWWESIEWWNGDTRVPNPFQKP